MDPEEDEEPLGGNSGAGVVRVGNTVRRAITEASPAVPALLRHLEDAGFEHAPRLLGVDAKGREILTYHPGQSAWHLGPSFWSAERCTRLGALVRELHDVMASFVVPAHPHWSGWLADPLSGSQIIHNDLGPWNLVHRPD
ncbi:MAG: hypothetical protein ACRDZR_06705 [Acidimicrobiales bacterium]